ncbi:hypothetical protein [Pantoea sp. 18069]|uniref:hypothetical protein n=1 Tax=Pantoea sp. 18069 TaxID=2681415 RepID=UPI001359383F|nr:hypothetical protein [Pantoea sp. 18069]
MSISLGLNNLQQIGRAEIASMDLQTALLTVNSMRIGNLETSLKNQVSEVQERNIQMRDTNDLMSLARSLMAKFATDAQSSDRIPEGTELDAFTKSAKAMGFDAGSVGNKGELGAAIENFKSRVDSLSNTQQIAMLHLQSASNKYNEAVTLQTNTLKSMHDLNMTITQKM